MSQMYPIGSHVRLNSKGVKATQRPCNTHTMYMVTDYDGMYYRIEGLGLFIPEELEPVTPYKVEDWSID